MQFTDAPVKKLFRVLENLGGVSKGTIGFKIKVLDHYHFIGVTVLGFYCVSFDFEIEMIDQATLQIGFNEYKIQ